MLNHIHVNKNNIIKLMIILLFIIFEVETHKSSRTANVFIISPHPLKLQGHIITWKYEYTYNPEHL